VGILLAVDPVFLEHDSGPGHPERPARLEAVERGITEAGLDDAIERVDAAPASRASVERVHKGQYLDAVERFCDHGGGYLDGDTHVGPRSYEAARETWASARSARPVTTPRSLGRWGSA